MTTQIKGVDVYQGDGPVDWVKVKAAGYQFAMIKATEGSNYSHVDYFRTNVPKAVASGMHVGAYHYSNFGTVSEAIDQARYFVSVAQEFKAKLDYPLSLDLEENKQKVSQKQLTDAAIAFMDFVINAGFPIILYTYDTFLNDQLDKTRLTKYEKWLARYGHPLENSAAIWQYSETGSVPGIGGNVDLNIAYRDFAVKPVQTDTKPPSQPATTTPTQTGKNGWEKDATSHWHYYKNGVLVKSAWIKHTDGKWYYLKADGTMAAAEWVNYKNKWYYVDAHGAMQQGWLKYKSSWYYLNPAADKGEMMTGWIMDKGKKYYLDDKGKMVTGKQVIGGKTYTFAASGTLIY